MQMEEDFQSHFTDLMSSFSVLSTSQAWIVAVWLFLMCLMLVKFGTVGDEQVLFLVILSGSGEFYISYFLACCR